LRFPAVNTGAGAWSPAGSVYVDFEGEAVSPGVTPRSPCRSTSAVYDIAHAPAGNLTIDLAVEAVTSPVAMWAREGGAFTHAAVWPKPDCSSWVGRGAACPPGWSDAASTCTDNMSDGVWSFLSDADESTAVADERKEGDLLEFGKSIASLAVVIEGECFAFETTSPAAVRASLRSGQISGDLSPCAVVAHGPAVRNTFIDIAPVEDEESPRACARRRARSTPRSLGATR